MARYAVSIDQPVRSDCGQRLLAVAALQRNISHVADNRAIPLRVPSQSERSDFAVERAPDFLPEPFPIFRANRRPCRQRSLERRYCLKIRESRFPETGPAQCLTRSDRSKHPLDRGAPSAPLPNHVEDRWTIFCREMPLEQEPDLRFTAGPHVSRERLESDCHPHRISPLAWFERPRPPRE